MPCVARGPAPTAVRLRGATAGTTTDGARRGRFRAAGRATAPGALAVLSSCRHTGCTLLHTLQAHNMHTHTHTSPWERALDKGSCCRKSHKPSEAIQTAWATSAGQWRILWTLGSGTLYVPWLGSSSLLSAMHKARFRRPLSAATFAASDTPSSSSSLLSCGGPCLGQACVSGRQGGVSAKAIG